MPRCRLSRSALAFASPATPDMDLKINGSDTKLLAGTFGRGLWEVTLPTAKNG